MNGAFRFEEDAERLVGSTVPGVDQPVPARVGFVVDHAGAPADGSMPADQVVVPYPFNSADELLKHSVEHGMAVSTLMLENEKALLAEPEVRSRVLAIWAAMDACVKRGCEREGILPGGLKVKRRAAALRHAGRPSARRRAATDRTLARRVQPAAPRPPRTGPRRRGLFGRPRRL